MLPCKPKNVDATAAMDDVDLCRVNADLRRQVELLNQRIDALNQEQYDDTVTEENPWFNPNPSPEQRDRH